ncbi:50S ribosomal protein L10 [Pasteuria penetrans]|uniref:50S ribosomal protein L10 n=1 Tax=Pasteuria penetrans TaxID=86005 RepID=UPI000FA55436|nr:50S ribosomal protein L10 [Pasteuria penetrans]
MKAALQKKQEKVADVASRMSAAKSTVLADYRGLASKENEDLRRQLKEAGAVLCVAKNTLVRRAAEEVGIEGLDAYLQGPTALAFAVEDALAPVRVLCAFSRKHKALKVKGAVLEGEVVDKGVLDSLADVPSREALLSMLLSVLQAPMRGMASVLQQRAEKVEEAG